MDFNSQLEHQIFTIVSCLSIVFSLLVFMTTIWNKSLNVHPYNLVAFIALIEAAFYIAFVSVENICWAHLPQLWSWTVYYSTDEADYKKALWLLFVSS